MRDSNHSGKSNGYRALTLDEPRKEAFHAASVSIMNHQTARGNVTLANRFTKREIVTSVSGSTRARSSSSRAKALTLP